MHTDPNDRSDAPRGNRASPPPKPTPDHPTPTSDDAASGEMDEEQAAHENTREAEDNPSG